MEHLACPTSLPLMNLMPAHLIPPMKAPMDAHPEIVTEVYSICCSQAHSMNHTEVYIMSPMEAHSMLPTHKEIIILQVIGKFFSSLSRRCDGMIENHENYTKMQ